MADEQATRRPKKLPAFFFCLSFVAILAFAAAVRICCALNDLWLDEILAVNMGHEVVSLTGFFQLHNEVNHHLYTLYLGLLEMHSSPLLFRLPSLLAGVGTVALAGLIGRQFGNPHAIFAMLMTAASYILTLYSTEARGYALAVFFSLVCYWLLIRHFETRRFKFALLFSCAALLGLLSQIIFLSFYSAAFLWSLVRWWRSGLGRRKTATAVLACHLLPLVCVVVIYFADLRHLTNVGGTSSESVWQSYATALAWAWGVSNSQGFRWLGVLLSVVVLPVGIYLFWKTKSDQWLLFLGVIVVLPLLLVLLRGSMVIYTRYFILSIAFLLVLGSFVLGEAYQRGTWGKVLCVVLLPAYLLANGWQIAKLMRWGRGQYREAIHFMSEHSSSSVVTIGSDHDFRSGTILRYYAPVVMPHKQSVYVLTGQRPPQGPEWVIRHKESFDPPAPPGLELRDADGNYYDFQKAYPSAPLSGLPWFIYHNRSNALREPE